MTNEQNLNHKLTVDELRKGEQKSSEAKFIKRQQRKDGAYGKTEKGNRPEAV